MLRHGKPGQSQPTRIALRNIHDIMQYPCVSAYYHALEPSASGRSRRPYFVIVSQSRNLVLPQQELPIIDNHICYGVYSARLFCQDSRIPVTKIPVCLGNTTKLS